VGDGELSAERVIALLEARVARSRACRQGNPTTAATVGYAKPAPSKRATLRRRPSRSDARARGVNDLFGMPTWVSRMRLGEDRCDDSRRCPRPVRYRIVIKVGVGPESTRRVCEQHKFSWQDIPGAIVSCEEL
jgi:hypothetical protein